MVGTILGVLFGLFIISGGTGILEALAYTFIHGAAFDIRMHFSCFCQFRHRLTGVFSGSNLQAP